MSFPFFDELVPELQREVLRQCDARSLAARTSKTMHDYAIPLLYRHVDISCHNDPGTHLSYTRRQVGPEHPGRRLGSRYKRFQIRQQVLIDTLHKYPIYAKYTEQLTFTYFDFLDLQNDRRSNITDMTPLWSAFRLMSRAKVVDFASFAKRGGLKAPQVCFQNVEHLRLSGQMPLSFVTMFMGCITPTKLISLELNNLQNVGQLSEGEDIRDYTYLNLVPETDNCQHPGPMRGHLKPLVGECPNLQSLKLRSLGQDMEQDRYWSLSRESDRYQECASFINSVKSTLVNLTIEQGTGPGEDHTHNKDMRTIPQHGTPMDSRFISDIYDTLLEGPWPVLKYMEILGLGGTPRDHVRNFQSRSMVAYIQELNLELGPQFYLVIDQRVRRTFYERVSGNYYEPQSSS